MSRRIYKYRVLKHFEVGTALFKEGEIIYASETYRYNGNPVYATNVYRQDGTFVGTSMRTDNFEIKNFIKEEN